MSDGTSGDGDNVVGISGHKSTKGTAPNPECVEVIEMLLEQAKSGGLRQIAFVYIDSTGEPIDGYAPGASGMEVLPIIGGLELCKTTLLLEMLGVNNNTP